MKTTFRFAGSEELIPVRILNALQAAEYTDEQIYLMSKFERFSKFCEWEGLINWADTLWDAVLESQ